MVAQNREAANQSGGIVEFFWNVVGGAMISAMLAGVIYVLFGMIGAHISGTDQYWELVFHCGTGNLFNNAYHSCQCGWFYLR